MVKRQPRTPKLGLHSYFGPISRVEFENWDPENFGQPYCALSSLFNLSEWTWPTRNVKEIGQMLFDVVKRRNWCLGSKIWQHNKLMAMRSFSTIFFPSSSSLTNQEKLLKTDFIFGLNLFRVLKKLKVLFETAVQSVVGYQCWKGRKLWT